MSFVAWLEKSFDAVAAASRHAFPAIVPHRLNRKEYANAVHELLALEIDPAEFLPQDEEVMHFDNIASGLQVSPSFIEQYVIAARALAVRAVGRPDARPGSQTYHGGPRQPADARAGPAARHARRNARDSHVPVRRRVRRQHRGHGSAHLGQRHGVRERRGRDRGRQDRSTRRSSAARKTEALRPGAERRHGEDQQAPQRTSGSTRPPARTRSA